jgi:hypothetical protein
MGRHQGLQAVTDTLEKAIDWMDRALRETRETLAEMDPDKREEATRNAGYCFVDRAIQAGAVGSLSSRWDGRTSWRVEWHQIEVCAHVPFLTIFDMWLAAARVKAGAQ